MLPVFVFKDKRLIVAFNNADDAQMHVDKFNDRWRRTSFGSTGENAFEMYGTGALEAFAAIIQKFEV